jgi:hypothetical protein
MRNVSQASSRPYPGVSICRAFPAADREAIAKVLEAGVQAQGDCYDWERGGKW